MALVWVATAPIHFNNVLAFNPGNVVPDSVVSRFNLSTSGLVEHVEGSSASGPHYGVDPVTQTEFNALVSGTGRLSDAALRSAFGRVYLVPAATGVAATDQAAIQAVIDQAADDGGGLVDLRDGAYAMNAELILKDRVLVRGQGIRRTTLGWSTDLGSGKFAVRQNVGAGFQVDAPAMADLSILGPSNSVPLGSSPAAMDGWQIGRNVSGTNVEVKGFHAGGVFIGDHNTMTACLFVNSYYNVLFPEVRLTSGNQMFIGCSFTGATFAGIAVEGNASIDSSYFIGGHIGFEPYGLYKFGNGATSAVISNTVLDGLAFEAIGNAAILDESTTTGTSIYRCTINFPGHSWLADYKIAARSKDFAVNVQGITDTYLRGTFSPGDVASFNVRDGFSGMTIEYGDVPPTIVCPGESFPGPLLETGGATARYMKALTTITARDLLEASGAAKVAPYGTNGREFAGVALASGAANTWVPVAYRGFVGITNSSTAITAGGTPVRPAAGAPTKVSPALGGGSNGYTYAPTTVFPDRHPIIGTTDRDIAANATGNIWLRDPAPDRTYVTPGAVSALPTASDTYRGQMLRVEGGSGVADGLYVCAKDSANAYSWRTLDHPIFLDVSADGGGAGFQTIGAGFSVVILSGETDDTAAAFDPATHLFTVPVTGLYECTAKIRLFDDPTGGVNFGLGIHTASSDGPWFKWQMVDAEGSAGSRRISFDYLRIGRFAAGDQLRLFAFSSAPVDLQSANMTIRKVG